MDINAILEAGPPTAQLPTELQLHVLSFLPPIHLTLSGRLSCKEAAQRFSEPHHCTAPISRPLPDHVVDTAWCLEGAQAAMAQLTSHQKLHMLTTAAASGCEANVEFAWQLLQPHVFPELLHMDDYLFQVLLRSSMHKELDLGSAAVSSGLAHLLPSLAQRCPGLLDPGRTLEAAARHCDLAGLQAVWEVVLEQLLLVLAKTEPDADRTGYDPDDGEWAWEAVVDRKQWVWRETMATVAAMPTSDALAKMKWVLAKSAGSGSCITVRHPTVCGAAAASGDLARLAWMRDHGFPWGTVEALAAVVRHADLAFIQQLEQEGGYLPSAEHVEAWTSEGVLCEAAASRRDSTAKLQWLASRGAASDSWKALRMAAACGNLEAVQLLAGQHGLGPAEGEGDPSDILYDAIESGSVPLVTWLRQAGYPWYVGGFEAAFHRGDLPMVRWLLEAGCPRSQHDSLGRAAMWWPCLKPGGCGRLVEAVRLLVAAG